MAQQKAATALGRLDGITALLPDPAILSCLYARKEAVLSSQIAGNPCSLPDLLGYAGDRAPGGGAEEAAAVASCLGAFTHGLRRLEEGAPVGLRLVREIHEALFGQDKSRRPGAFRTSQNWIGGSLPEHAAFVPPPQEALPACLAVWESFLHGPTDPLTKAALAHAQFETIHPFLDGNGRVGRMLIPLILSSEGVLKPPMLYLSQFLKQHQEDYHALLQEIRQSGDWEAWLHFFFRGLTETANGAVATARTLLARFELDRAAILAMPAPASALQVHAWVRGRPVSASSAICQATGLTAATVNKALEHLGSLGILKEITGRRRNRLFAYERVLEALAEGGGP
jgi:Fic family protein